MNSKSPSVNLTKRIKTTKGYRYCQVVISANGRVKPDVVVIEGVEMRVTDGSYYLDWHNPETQKRDRERVGPDALAASNRLLRKAAELKAKAAGVEVVKEEELVVKTPLKEAADLYIEEKTHTCKEASVAAYRTAVEYFLRSLEKVPNKVYVEQLERMDMLRFASYLRSKGLSDRTTSNKFRYVIGFLNTVGKSGLVSRGDWPKYTEGKVEIYDHEDLDALRAVSTEEEKLWWDFFLMTGMRVQEVRYLTWGQINDNALTVRVQENRQYRWKPKSWEEREVPVPAVLIDRLVAHRPADAELKSIVFPTKGKRPRKDWWERLMACAERAGLNPAHFWPHKFRASFASWHLQNGTDLHTVQLWVGHKDIKTTMRYLSPARGASVRAAVESAFVRHGS